MKQMKKIKCKRLDCARMMVRLSKEGVSDKIIAQIDLPDCNCEFCQWRAEVMEILNER